MGTINKNIGPCIIEWNEEKIGGSTVAFYKTLGGVIFRYEELQVPIKRDQAGETEVGAVTTGVVNPELEVPMTQEDVGRLVHCFSNASAVAGSNLKVSNPISKEVFPFTRQAIVKPIVNGFPSVIEEEWLHIHRAFPFVTTEQMYDNIRQQCVKVIFKGYPDDGKGRNHEIWRYGIGNEWKVYLRDDFDDGIIGGIGRITWITQNSGDWTTQNTDINRTIVEAEIEKILTIAIENNAHGDWCYNPIGSQLNDAPKLYKQIPRAPIEFITKLNSCTINAGAYAGIFIASNVGAIVSDGAYLFGRHGAVDGLVNGNMETWITASNLADWNENDAGGACGIAREAVRIHGGTYSCKIFTGAPGDFASIDQNFTLTAGDPCTFSFWYENPTAGVDPLRVYIKDTGNNVYLKSDGTWGAGVAQPIFLAQVATYTKYELPLTVNAGYSNYNVRFYKGHSPGNPASAYYIDDAHFFMEEEGLIAKNTTPGDRSHIAVTTLPIWLRVRIPDENNSDVLFYYSEDGINWTLLHTASNYYQRGYYVGLFASNMAPNWSYILAPFEYFEIWAYC